MLKIHVLNVGLGDSLIIETSNPEGEKLYSIIDCKKIGGVTPTVQFLQEKEIRNLSSLLITHLHEDHISGLPDLYDYLKTNGGTLNFFITPNLGDEAKLKQDLATKLYRNTPPSERKRLIKSLKDIESLLTDSSYCPEPTIMLRGAYEGSDWKTQLHPGLEFAFLHPNHQEALSFLKDILKREASFKNNLNDISLVFMLKEAQNSSRLYLFCGDLDRKQSWLTIANRFDNFTSRFDYTDLKYVKFPHHGGKNHPFISTLSKLTHQENDLFVSFSCPFNDKNHPHQDTLYKLKNSFKNVHFACTNMSQPCFHKSSKEIEPSDFFDKTEEEEEFDDFVENKDKYTCKECAGDHIFLCEKEFKFKNSTGCYCNFGLS